MSQQRRQDLLAALSAAEAEASDFGNKPLPTKLSDLNNNLNLLKSLQGSVSNIQFELLQFNDRNKSELKDNRRDLGTALCYADLFHPSMELFQNFRTVLGFAMCIYVLYFLNDVTGPYNRLWFDVNASVSFLTSFVFYLQGLCRYHSALLKILVISSVIQIVLIATGPVVMYYAGEEARLWLAAVLILKTLPIFDALQN